MAVVAMLAAAAAMALTLAPRFTLPESRAPVPASRSLPVPLLAAASAGFAALLLIPQPWGSVAALVAGVATVRVVRRLEPAALRRRRAQLEAALPHVVDLMSTCLAAGGSPAGSLGQIAGAVETPMSEELNAYAARLGLGADPASVWAAMAKHAQLGPLGRALQRSSETGSSVSDALSRAGAELRTARQAALEARARTIEVKASVPLGLCLLPAFVLVGIVPMVAGSFSLTFLGS